MDIAFSTLGCPDLTWEDILVTAVDLGFDGIEIRGIENELYVPKALQFTAANLQATKERLKKLNLAIPALTSSCYLSDKENIGGNMSEGEEYIDLAVKLGVPYVRVLGDNRIDPGNDIDLEFLAANLNKLAAYAAGKNVMLLIETNGVLADTSNMLYVLIRAGTGNVGVLWDIHHPFRFFNEPVRETYQKLGQYIKFVHIKDSLYQNGSIKYKITGYGDVPVREALLLLKEDGYKGFVSLEWVKRWCMDLEDPGVVFSHFINYVKNIID